MTTIMIDSSHGNPHHEGERVHVRACPVYGGVAVCFGDDETEINISEETAFNVMHAIARWGGVKLFTPGEDGDLIEWLANENAEASRPTLEED